MIPTTIIAYRLSMGSVNAAEIVGTTLIATAIATAAAIILDKWFQRKNFPAGKG
ncbi:Spore maturation protein A [compost metagenome]